MESSELAITLFVTHVETEGLLLRIWGHRDRKAVSCLDEMILPLGKKFSQGLGVPKPGLNLPPGLICCAKFQKEEYRRAKICRTQPDKTVIVHFIDYGNSEILPMSDIRLLRHHPNAARLQALQPLACDFVLADVMAANGGWGLESLERIKEALCFTHVTGEFHSIFKTQRLLKLCFARISNKFRSTYKTRRLLKLCYKNEDFREFLVSKELAVRASVQEMFSMRIYVSQAPQSRAIARPGYSYEQKNNQEEMRMKNHKEGHLHQKKTQNSNFLNRCGGGNKFGSGARSRDDNRAFDSLNNDNIWRGLGQLFKGKGRKRRQGTQGHQGKRQPTRRQRRRQSTEFRKMERRRQR